MIGNDPLPLQQWMMKPFSCCNRTAKEKIFIYHLSQERFIVKNAFGNLANHFRCLLTTMFQSPENAKPLVLATVALHNIMRTQNRVLQNALLDREGNDQRLIPILWRNDAVMQEMDEVRAPTVETRSGKWQRILLKNFVNSPQRAVP